MAFREKIAWLSLVAMIVAYAVYFTIAAPMVQRGSGSTAYFIVLLAGVLVVQALVVIVASLAITLQSGREAHLPADERDRAIDRRAAAVAYYVLMVGMIAVGCIMPFRDSGWVIVNAALFMLAAAEIVRYALIVLSYRRGWHG